MFKTAMLGQSMFGTAAKIRPEDLFLSGIRRMSLVTKTARSRKPRKKSGFLLAAATALPMLLAASAVQAIDFEDGAVSVNATYVVDYSAAVAGATSHSGNVMHNLLVSGSADLERLGGPGVNVYASVLTNAGGKANNAAGTLQGVDNIEVAQASTRLFELWAETDLAGIGTRAGLYDLNSEFYSTPTAALFLAPAFGIGSELSSTGPNGPSIFPSTALAMRARTQLSSVLTFKFAVLDAKAGVLGDPGGVDVSFKHGVLFISELEWEGFAHTSIGAWRYSRKQEDIANPAERKAAYGAYISVERPLWGNEHTSFSGTGFLRAGMSDGDTTPFNGGWQAGLLLNRVLPGRPNSTVAFGVYQGRLGAKEKDDLRNNGIQASSSETGFELTASDQLTPWLRIQPDIQVIHNPNADGSRNDAWVATLRAAFTL